jgi:hypothetical protein
MLNAHLRFGWLHVDKDNGKSFRVRLDRFIAEPATGRYDTAKAHLISVVGGDTQIAAISAALSEGKTFRVEGPELKQVYASFMTKKPQTYRASLQIPGRKRAIRHLVASSEELSTGAPKLVLADSSPDFVWRAVCQTLGLPGAPEWAEWFDRQLMSRNAAKPLRGIGCSPVLIARGRDEILSWMGEGVASGALTFPMENQAIAWPTTTLQQVFQLEVTEAPQVIPQ